MSFKTCTHVRLTGIRTIKSDCILFSLRVMKDLLVFSPIDLKLFSSENQEVELLLVVHMLSEYLTTLIIHTHTHTYKQHT